MRKIHHDRRHVCYWLVIRGQYSGTDRDDYVDTNTAMTAYLNAKINLHQKMFIMPEIGMIDEQDNENGVAEGSRMYFGLNLQADFDLNIK